MKIVIETFPNTVTNEVAEGLTARLKVLCETPAGSRSFDEPICCEACGVKKALSAVNKIVFAAEIDQVKRAFGGAPPKPEPGEEWKEDAP